jgi:hypothetical protein
MTSGTYPIAQIPAILSNGAYVNAFASLLALIKVLFLLRFKVLKLFC